jgi:putative toxin-antitoxin system antitoxin component (TIGR02293 family)
MAEMPIIKKEAMMQAVKAKMIIPDPDRFCDLSEMIDKRVSPEMFSLLKETYNVTSEELSLSTRIPVRTINSRIQKKQLLTPEESERVVRMMRLFKIAEKTFKGRDKVEKWFRMANRALGGATPLEFARNEQGAREVENILGRIRHGVFS